MFDLFALVPPAELATFVAAGLVLNLTPGADVLFATASGLAGGPRVGAVAGLGAVSYTHLTLPTKRIV